MSSDWDLYTPLLTDAEIEDWETEALRDVARAQAAKIVAWLEERSYPYEPADSFVLKLKAAISADPRFQPRTGRVSLGRESACPVEPDEDTDEHTAI